MSSSSRIKKRLMGSHPMTDSGLVSKTLGVRVTWDEDGSIQLDQKANVERILDEFRMKNSLSNETRMNNGTLLNDKTSEPLDKSEHKLSRRIVGRRLMFLATMRQDIAFNLNRLSLYLSGLQLVHLGAPKHM